jgi:type II secretory pathway pseudopilin PulG
MKDDGPYQRFFNQAGVTLLELLIAILILVSVSVGVLGVFEIAGAQNKQQGEYATRCTEYAQDKMEQLMALQFSDASSDTSTIPWASVAYSSGYTAWSSATTYSYQNNVNYGGVSYSSNIGGLSPPYNTSPNLNIIPGTTTTPAGGTGLGGLPPWSQVAYSSSYATWSSSTSYSSGNNVNYSSVSYVSNISSNLNNTPGVSQTFGGIPPGTAVTSPVLDYVDYLDASGKNMGGGLPPPTAPLGAFYIRMWQIQNNAAGVPYSGAPAGTVKIITVYATMLGNPGAGGVLPQSTVVCVKANF